MLLLHLPDNLSRHRGMEIDCVMPQPLSCLVTLTTTTFEWFTDTDLCSVTILSMVLYAIHILWRRQKYHVKWGHWIVWWRKTLVWVWLQLDISQMATVYRIGFHELQLWPKQSSVFTVGCADRVMQTATPRPFQVDLKLTLKVLSLSFTYNTYLRLTDCRGIVPSEECCQWTII